MFLRKARRIGRIFAVTLLVWTAVDLLDYRACENHGELPAAVSPTAMALLASGGAGPTDQGHPGPLEGHAGDCFCCSAFVDVKTPFLLSFSETGVWLQPPDSPVYTSIPLSHLYRPPIAA
jgi:hypothetical protein